MTIHGFLYLITNTVNGRLYVGQTTNKNPKARFSQHKRDAKKHNPQYAISRAIKKYGIENFTFEIIGTASNQKQLNFLEEKYIKEYRSHVSENGYNVNYKAEGKGMLSDETKQKQSILANTPRRKAISRNNGINSRGNKLKADTSSSKYVWVHYSINRWIAQISYCKKRINLGRFLSEEDAAKAYDIAAIKYFGADCKLNFPDLYQSYIDGIVSVQKCRKKTDGSSVGICYLNNCNRWRARYNNKSKYCHTLEEAETWLKTIKDQTHQIPYL